MHSVDQGRRAINGQSILSDALESGRKQLEQAIANRLNELLVMAVTYLLGRDAYVRREQVGPWVELEGRCCRCGSCQVNRFVRNGYRVRSLLTTLGWIIFSLPRVRCACGGSVRLDFGGLIRPHQRLSDETDRQLQRWYRLGWSLRQIQQELEHCFIGPLSLQTLMTRVHQVAVVQAEEGTPPVVQVDALWVTQVLPNGHTFRDRKGRTRKSKGRFKRPIFIALGVWPEKDQVVVLDWMLANSEEEAEWLRFLSRLEEAGISGENGLKLILHDGGSGLCAALQTVHFDALYQRCLFHKLRNIANAIHLPAGLSRRQRTRQRKAILKHFRAIWEAKQLKTALHRYLQVVRLFRSTQPDAVAALRRDFRDTLSFFQLLPNYDGRHLRTTSRLERFNRTLRTRLRAANSLHSDQGLTAMITQQIHALHAI